MKFRTAPLFAFAALIAASAAAPAMAGDYGMGGIPVMGSTSNSLEASNTAAGVGNVADQDIHAKQSGFGGLTIRPLGYGKVLGGGPLVSNNTTVGTNVAAGIGNEADQSLHVGQRAGFGVTNNSVDALNLAAGIGNLATQNIHARQK